MPGSKGLCRGLRHRAFVCRVFGFYTLAQIALTLPDLRIELFLKRMSDMECSGSGVKGNKHMCECCLKLGISTPLIPVRAVYIFWKKQPVTNTDYALFYIWD